MHPRLTIEAWEPEYGSPIGEVDGQPSSEASVDPTIELAPTAWRPLSPPSDTRRAERVAFVDGVRRIDALLWITERAGVVRRGLCASFAAGIVEAADHARVCELEVRRGLFSACALETLATAAGEYEPLAVAGDDLSELTYGLQRRLGALEIEIADQVRDGVDLIVVDGPLSGRRLVRGAVGYVKTHQVAYLRDELALTVAALAPGQRTPLFLSTTSWTRYSWYLRLPGPISHPWSGVVRLEASGDLPMADVRRLADVSAVTLLKFASVPHKDPRAPQNLYPIGGLERELRRRLGDAGFVQRALRRGVSETAST